MPSKKTPQQYVRHGDQSSRPTSEDVVTRNSTHRDTAQPANALPYDTSQVMGMKAGVTGSLAASHS